MKNIKTKRISEEEIKGLPVLATGYKMFRNDWTTKYGKYDYKDENGNVLGSIHKVEGELKECEWGFHFSKKPQDCFNFYECVQWNTFAKVEAFGNSIDSKDGNKSVASIIRIVEIYSFDEFIDLIQKELQNCDIVGGNRIVGGNDIIGGYHIVGGNNIIGGNYIRGGNHIRGGNNIGGGKNIRGGNNIGGGKNIRGGNDIVGGNDIGGGNDIVGGNHIRGGNHIGGGNFIIGGNDIRGGNDIVGGNDIIGGYHIVGGNNIIGGNYIRGGNHIRGGNNIYFSRKLRAASKCIFCFDLEGCKLMLFNKKISQERFNKVKNELNNFSWYPKFNNAEELRGNLAWHETNIPAIVNIENKIAYSSMPQDMIDYIRSLPEFDKKIFNKIIN